MALIVLASLVLIFIKMCSFGQVCFWHVENIFQDGAKMLPEKAKNNKTIAKEAPSEEQSSVEASVSAEPAADLPVRALAQADKSAGEERGLPTKILIDVPFTSQAPLGKWDAYHEEACEEASLLMVKYYLRHKSLTPIAAEKEIQALIAYEIKNTNGYKDSTAAQTAKLGADYYDMKNLQVIYDFTAEDLKKYLSLGKPIIVPAAGRLLDNPNFTAPGPLYHNLVLIGYDGDTIVTNDPGTRKGASYRYNIQVLYNAIHDFPGDAKKIETGRKAMIVLE